jgi:hypothetical protein
MVFLLARDKKMKTPAGKKPHPLGMIIPNGVKIRSGFRPAASQTCVQLFKINV